MHQKYTQYFAIKLYLAIKQISNIIICHLISYSFSGIMFNTGAKKSTDPDDEDDSDDDEDSVVNANTAALIKAFSRGRSDIFRNILRKEDVNVNVMVEGDGDRYSESILSLAIRKEDICTVKLLLSDYRIDQKEIARHLFRADNSKAGAEIARLLIEIGGCDVNKEAPYSDYGYRMIPLIQFIKHYHPKNGMRDNDDPLNLDLLDCILEHTDVNVSKAKGHTYHETPLMAAIGQPEEVVWKIIKAGADLDDDYQNNGGVMFWAGWFRHDYFVRILLEARIMKGINECDKHGNSCLTYAISADPLVLDETIFSLISRGIDVNIQNKAGETALMMLMKRSDFPKHPPDAILNKLLLVGADVNLEDKSGKTALYYAMVKKHHRQFCQRLLESRTQINMLELFTSISLRVRGVVKNIVTTGKAYPKMFDVDFVRNSVVGNKDLADSELSEDELCSMSPLYLAFLGMDESVIQILLSARFLNDFDIMTPRHYISELFDRFYLQDPEDFQESYALAKNFYCHPKSLMNTTFVRVSSMVGFDLNREELISKTSVPMIIKKCLLFKS